MNDTSRKLIEQKKTRVLELAKNYTGNTFSQDFRKEYEHAFNHNYIGELREVIRINKAKKAQQYKKEVLKLAQNYHGNTFSREYSYEYGHANTYGYLTELQKILAKKKGEKFRTIMNRTFKLANSYNGKCFNKDHSFEYGHALQNGYLKQIRKILYSRPPVKGAKRALYSQKQVLKMAKSYKGKCFQKDHPGAYLHAFRNKYLPEIRLLLNRKG